MKAVILSVRPEWCQKIVDGNKTVEVRKSKPKLETPFKCYIYCTYGKGLIERWDEVLPNFLIDQKVTKGKMWGNLCNGKVIGEFVCDRVYQYSSASYIENTDISTEEMSIQSCLSPQELSDYELSAEPKENCIYLIGIYGWHISQLEIYAHPKELSWFYKNGTLSNEDYLNTLYDGHRTYAEYLFTRQLRKAPQSWGYVETLEACP